MRNFDYVKIPLDFFHDPKIVLLREEENGVSIILLWMQMLLSSRQKNDMGDYEFSLFLGNYQMNDADLAHILSFKGNISEALDKLEYYGLVKRNKEMIVCIPYWKHDPNSRDRNSPEYKAWRNKVFARDGSACQTCGDTKNLNAHHIVPWHKDESKRFDVDNGITLCHSCHYIAHGGNWRD